MKLLLLLLTLNSSAWAVTTAPDCLTQFTMLADGDGDPIAVSVSTYERLLNALGAQLNPETLRKITKGEDPFEVPEQADTDLFALRKHLNELKALMEKKGWNTPEVRRALLDRIASRTGAQEEQTAKTKERLSEGWFDFTLKLGDWANPAYTISHDGRYVALLDIPEDFSSSASKLLILDRLTNKEKTYPFPTTGLHGHLHFDASGSHLYLFSQEQVITAIPLKDGVPQLDKRETFDRSALGGPLTMPLPGENPRYVYSGKKSALQRVDLVTKAITKVEITKQMGIGPPLRVDRVGSVGNTDSIYAVATDPTGTTNHQPGWSGKIIVVGFDPNGNPLPARKVAQWGKAQRFQELVWTPDGKLITYLSGEFFAWPTPDGPVSIARTPKDDIPYPAGETPTYEIDVAVHPKGAAVLFRSGRWDSTVKYVDFEKGGEQKAFKVGDGAKTIRFSPDGEMLTTNNDGVSAHFINYKRRLLEP